MEQTCRKPNLMAKKKCLFWLQMVDMNFILVLNPFQDLFIRAWSYTFHIVVVVLQLAKFGDYTMLMGRSIADCLHQT